MAGFSLKDLEFFRNHLFLPPGLPQEDDQDVCFDDALLRIVLEALNAFGNLVTEEQRLIIDHVIAAISMLQQTRSIDGEVNEKELLKGLMNMSVNDNPATIPLYINAQNAGVIFSRQSDGIQFESFEVSPENSAAMSTQGRLRRCFPGPLLCIKKEHCKQPELLSNLANTLSKLSFQKAGMTPKVRKSQNKVEETRDTTHPGLISELVVAFLQPVSSVPTAHKIWKNTREEVLWKDTLHPWRRSPLWLLLRTVMQLLFTRFQVARPSEPATTTSRCLYKPFMIYLLATVLSKSISLGRSTEPDIIFCMSAKIHRRMLKLNSEEHEPGISVVQQVQNRARHHLEQRWLKIQELDSRRLSLDQLTTLEFKNDVSLSLPGIDDFLSVIPNRKPPNYLVQFSPPSSLLKVPYDSLPQNSLSDSVDTYMFYNLNAFEHWVASTLFTWLADNLQRTGTCAALKNLMHEYHSAALQAYTGNPETSSIMILTLLELWFACDKSAVALFPMLVDYNPGIKLEPLQSLLLPSKGYMVRLLHIEEYVKDRQDRGWRSAEGSIFRDFGLPDCFSVRYFDESLEHQDLLLRIQRDAEEKRKMKREELAVKKTRYETLMHQYDESSCDYYEFTDLWGIVQSRHSEDCCKRHSLRREAEKITIDVHEWPLPLNTLDAKSVVFELDAPEEFCSWRDATIFLLLDVLGAAYDSGVQPVSGYRLDSYTALQNSFRGAKSRRLGLLSTNKPHVVTHRNKKFSIPDITESSVCLNNGLRFHYHDASLRSFVDSFSQSDAVSKMCTYQLGKKASALQPFLFPRFEETASTPNEVISSQSECPPHLSLDEYRCLCGIPIGYRLQWMDILRQLAAPSVDWKKPETSLVIFQSIYQAGPQDSENFHRAAHLDLVEDAFTSSLLFAVDEAIGRIKENWESYQALSVFSCIVTRQLSLSPSPQLTARALTVLSRLREVAFDWLELLRTKCDDTEVEVQRRMFAERIVVIALICSGTFDVDDQNLELILSDDGNASILIQCGILIHELAPNGGKPPQSSKSRIQSILRHRWQRLSYRAYPILSRKVAGKDAATCLDLAVMSCWPVYRRLGQWETVVDNVDYWVVSNTLPDRLSGQSLKVHYNLLTGDLRVNGERLSRLPKQYEQHNSYLELFGSIVLQIMPSSVSGMKFSSKQCYAGYSLHFGMSGSNLLVRAIKDNGAFELVPKELIRGKLPTSFVDGFVHWYNMTADTVEFRPKQQPWTSASDTWILSRDSTSRAWKLSKKEHVLINPTSRTGEMLAGIFSPLQEPLQINITLAANGQTIHVELPRLKLEFSLEKGGSSVLCHQFQGLEVDSEQFIGSLIGLKNKLVLRNARTSDRRVIIPAGNVSFERNGDHVSVCIDPSPTSTHIYRLDNIMRLLRDNGNLQSQLFLCYLHAVTSFCLPDSLTDRTGTEQALSILKSKAVKSSPFLTKENMDLLKKIEALTPKRSYYPPQLQVMQTVDWDPRLPVLGQHPQFHECVVALWSQSKATKIYYKEYVEPPKPSDIHPILLRRDSLRSSTFRMSGFGAEEFSDALDSTYRSRDRGQSSERSKRAGLVATMLFHRQPHLQYQVSCFPSFTSHFLHLLRAVDVVMGPNNPDVTDTTLNYDGKWLKGQQDHWAGLWCWLHRRSRPVSSSSLGLHQVMMWFATMAFSSEVDMNIIQAAASMFCLPKMQDIQPPSIPRFSLNKGDVVKRPDLGTIIRQHCLSFIQSLDANLPKLEWESNTQWRDRRQAQYISNRDSAINKLIEHLASQWPCLSPAAPSGDSGETIWQYVKLNQVMVAVKPLFETWYENLRFRLYIQEIEAVIDAHSVEPLHFEVFHFESPQYAYVHQKRFISAADLFASSPPDNVPNGPKLSMKSVEGYLRNSEKLNRRTEKRVSSESKLKSLIQTCEKNARSPYERKYANDLRESYESLELLRDDQTNTAEFEPEELRPLLEKHLSDSVGHAANIFETMRMTMHDGLRRRFFTSNLSHGPRVSPVFLLRQLSHGGWDSRDGWDSLPATWKQWIVYYGLALTEIQRAKRLINSLDNSLDLLRELKNEGHTNWDATEYPDSLLIEIENDIMIRKVQEEIAAQMRQSESNNNTVMQLNMGEGKSSVIAPIVTAALANGSRLVRVVVAKPQSRQMFHMLVSKLGGLINRRIFHLPFSRDLKLDISHAQIIHDECQRCIDERGVMLVQPEHILSFKLMGLESLILDGNEGKQDLGKALLQTQHLFDSKSRDIVDESDENFSVKFELIYTMGMQGPIEFAPERWIVIQTVLEFVRLHVRSIRDALPLSIEVHESCSGSFPRTRLLREDATVMLLDQVAKDICDKGFPGFPISRQDDLSRLHVLKYITEPNLDFASIEKVEKGKFWTETTQHYLLLLRGLFARGILAFVFGHKRWRVNYGLDNTRTPSTDLAVPYRAKDNPTPRSEFSHPDVVIILTCMCYYYEGLNNSQMSMTFKHLLNSDQADAEYQQWVGDSENLPGAFHQLMGVNMEDKTQCENEVFPSFRFAKRTIDYFLQFIVFPKQIKEFPEKLSTSGWDIGAVKAHPTTGFSGTMDSRILLPLDVTYLPLPEQKATNALVLGNLLRPENGVILLDPAPTADVDQDASLGRQLSMSEAETLLSVVVGQRDPRVRVILDVGAQVLEMSNAQVAKRWLEMARVQDPSIHGAVFFDDNEELMVLDVNGFTESLRTSPFGEQLDGCLIFLDEAHTRGTDLKLPNNYRAAVTLASVTKDRLAQACMRMRKLGQGQSVVFCIPQDVQAKIRERMSPNDMPIEISHVLEWAISETYNDARKNMPLWAAQGQRFERHRVLWDEARTDTGIDMMATQAKHFLEEEAQTLEQRYRPIPVYDQAIVNGEATTGRLRQIRARCEDVGAANISEATLQEEQERELSPEIEQERQLERPAPAKAAKHILHADLRLFVLSGILPPKSPAFISAFQTLRETSAAKHLDVSMFPEDLLVTADFARTVQKAGKHSLLDAYQRPVQWVLTSQPCNWNHVIIVSPYEAQELLPAIRSSGKTTLHIYAPRPNSGIRPLDELNLYTVPSSSMQAMTPIPLHIKTQLNLFAGQLYFDNFSEYTAFCDMHRLSCQKPSEETEIAPDGFILSGPLNTSDSQTSQFSKSPVKFLKDFLTKARKDCQAIDKTHIGRLLDGALLQEKDFSSLARTPREE